MSDKKRKRRRRRQRCNKPSKFRHNGKVYNQHDAADTALESIKEDVRDFVPYVLEKNWTPRVFSKMIGMILNQLSDVVAATHAVNNIPSMDCKAGCHWCCALPVSATALEVAAAVEYLQENTTATRFDAIKECTIELDEKYGHLTQKERFGSVRFFCPLLVNRRCSVYPSRPLTCFQWTSYDVQACKQDYDNPGKDNRVNTDMVALTVGSTGARGLETGLKDVSLGHEDLDFITALRIAMDDPAAGAKWLDGEDVFQDAKWSSKGSTPVGWDSKRGAYTWEPSHD